MATAMKKKFKSTRPPSNPLNPVYKLPYTEPAPPVVNKFIRDMINVADIPGTQPLKLIPEKQRSELEYIEGTRPQKQFIPRDRKPNLFVEDINQIDKFVSSRHVNPLEAEY